MSRTCAKPSTLPTAALILTIALCSTSCRSSLTTTTATERSEASTEVTLGLSRIVDSVIVRETVVIRDRPDTVTVWRDRIQWRTRTVHDTLVVVKTDTVVRTETVEVERQSPALAGTPLKGGRGTRTPGWAWAAVLALAGLLAAQIIRVKNKLNNR